MKIFPRPSLYYVSPWLLAAAMALLLLIVVTFTLNNIQREQQLMKGALLEKADTLMRFVHSGSRSSYLADLRKGIWKIEPWHEYVQRILDHVSENPEIRMLAVIDETGFILAHNRRELIGQKLDFSLPRHDGASAGSIAHRIITNTAEGKIFEAVRPFLPHRSLTLAIPGNLRSRLHEGAERSAMSVPRQYKIKELPDNKDIHRSYYILVGLDMGGYDKSVSRLKLQALVLSVVMLLVGIGGWFSLAAIHGFRVSQRTLSEIKGFTSLLMAKLPVGIIATDGSGSISTWNSAASEMTGIAEAEASGKPPRTVLPGELVRFFRQDAVGGNCPPAGQEKEVMISIDGDKRYLLCHSIALGESGDENKGEVLLISNLTELKGLEKEMRENERLAAVGRMAAGVAHEVRNPLSSIKGLALLLKNRFAPDSRDRETAGLLIQEVDRMNRTVSELLSFARPAALSIQEVRLPELLNYNLRLVASDLRNNDIKARLQVDPDMKPVAGDQDRLNQVFINLLLNAVQAMADGGELTVTGRNSDRDNCVVVTVQDTGCGISPENLSQLFYPYFTTKPGGTGIGLAIAQKIINDHRGTIRIESIPDNGTTVIVELPAFQESCGT